MYTDIGQISIRIPHIPNQGELQRNISIHPTYLRAFGTRPKNGKPLLK